LSSPPSSPTRRSSDLLLALDVPSGECLTQHLRHDHGPHRTHCKPTLLFANLRYLSASTLAMRHKPSRSGRKTIHSLLHTMRHSQDRKSTRLNSSHVKI